ncbi:MAG: tetratricopeptide repeat protein [Robiginitomaculum sp.]|nr:tetratricopeptide repeat protein [Robiginitomaculum sp.]
MRAFLLISLFIMANVFSPAAYGQSRKELAAQNAQLAMRLQALENRMLTGDPAAERLMQRMDASETSQRALTGQVERLIYERDNLQAEVQSLAAALADLQVIAEDMQRHLQAVNIVAQEKPAPDYSASHTGGGAYNNGSSIPAPPVIVGNDISKLAEIGLEKMQEGDFSQAQTIFHQYLQLSPEASDRGDIYYWLGETYFIKGGFTDAADAYIASMRAAPNGVFAPDAMLRLAATARELGKIEMACQTLASFPTQFPNASEAIKSKAATEKQRSGC